jgi:hypothetical protein
MLRISASTAPAPINPSIVTATSERTIDSHAVTETIAQITAAAIIRPGRS